jgi:thiol-disulfide isomerase/thioredoxin
MPNGVMMMKWALRAVTLGFVLCLAGLGVLVYDLSGPRHAAIGAAQAQSADSSSGPLGQFTPLSTPLPAPEVNFVTASGDPMTLADFRGKMVLVNLWATWCAPCVAEMPSLERLQGKLGPDLAILAISEDRSGNQVVAPFRAKLGLSSLATYLDPKSSAAHAFGVDGLPTSILIDRDGRILGRLAGAAQWDSDEMLARLKSYMKEPESPLQKASATR